MHNVHDSVGLQRRRVVRDDEFVISNFYKNLLIDRMAIIYLFMSI